MIDKEFCKLANLDNVEISSLQALESNPAIISALKKLFKYQADLIIADAADNEKDEKIAIGTWSGLDKASIIVGNLKGDI